jgi:hypothetical protein
MTSASSPAATSLPLVPDRRNNARFALKLAVSIRLPRQRRAPARLLDISATGCRIMANRPLAPGMSLWLTIVGLEPQYCHIVWSHERFTGLHFAVPLSDSAFDRIVGDHGAVTERDTTELRALSKHAALLAKRVSPAEGTHLDALARDCAATVTDFETSVDEQRAAALEARRPQLLARLSDGAKG